MKYKTFKTFVCEELDDNPNPKSGPLEVDLTRDNTSSGLKTKPSKKAIIISLAKGIASGGKDHRNIIKRLMDAGVDGSDVMDGNREVESRVNDPSHTNYKDRTIEKISQLIRKKRNDQ